MRVSMQVISNGSYRLCKITRKFWVRDRQVAVLTAKQFNMMGLLVKASPENVSSEDLLKAISKNADADLGKVDIYIHRLRIRLGRFGSHIQNGYGKGFRLSSS